jgi:hypothetical protein
VVRKIEWEAIVNKCSLEEMWSKFCDKIPQAVDKKGKVGTVEHR